jgi:hypothetical protein
MVKRKGKGQYEEMCLNQATKDNRSPTSESFPRTLPRDVFLIILRMMAPEDMMLLAKASLELQTWMSYEIVVRNAVLLGGGHAEWNISKVIALVQKQQVYMPSIPRMLAIACRGNKKASSQVNATYAVFLCKTCIKTHQVLVACPTIETIDRFAKSRGLHSGGGNRSWFLLAKSVLDGTTKEALGPVLAYEDLGPMMPGRQMSSTGWGLTTCVYVYMCILFSHPLSSRHIHQPRAISITFAPYPSNSRHIHPID